MQPFNKFTTEPVLDEVTLKRIDDDYRAGKLDHLKTPVEPLDSSSDPLGMNFDWLFGAEMPRLPQVAIDEKAATQTAPIAK